MKPTTPEQMQRLLEQATKDLITTGKTTKNYNYEEEGTQRLSTEKVHKHVNARKMT